MSHCAKLSGARTQAGADVECAAVPADAFFFLDDDMLPPAAMMQFCVLDHQTKAK